MDKKGDTQILMFEIAYISFAILIGLAVLYFVYSNTKDTSFQAKLYSQDIANTIGIMQSVNGNKIIVNYELKENFQFRLDDNFVYVIDEDIIIKSKYAKSKNSEIKFERKDDLLILEKNDK